MGTSNNDEYPIGDPRRYDAEVKATTDALNRQKLVRMQADLVNIVNSNKRAGSQGKPALVGECDVVIGECISIRELIDTLPVAVTPCLARVHGIPTKPVVDGYCMAIAADKRVYFPNPMTGEWYPTGWDVTGYVTDVKLP